MPDVGTGPVALDADSVHEQRREEERHLSLVWLADRRIFPRLSSEVSRSLAGPRTELGCVLLEHAAVNRGGTQHGAHRGYIFVV